MSDVRLTATNPEDSSVVPVACNAKGELKLEEPIDNSFDGNLEGDLTVSGTAYFAGNVTSSGNIIGTELFSTGNSSCSINSGVYGTGTDVNITSRNPYGAGAPFVNIIFGGVDAAGASYTEWARFTPPGFECKGGATFAGDVVVHSRSKQWMLVEQGGLCHMVQQARASTADLVDPAAVTEYPKLRDVFAELNVIEKALEEVMAKLRMTEPDGWPVWDGSDNS